LSETEKAVEKRNNQRRILSKFVDLPVSLLIKCNVTPDILSYFGFACSITVAFLLTIGGLHFPFAIAWIIPFIMFWAGAFDVFDGEVARRTGSISKAGAFLDSNLDRLSDAAIILGLVLGNFLNFILGYFIIFLIIMISYIRSRAENEGIDMKGVGFMERAERLIILWFAFIVEFWLYFSGTFFPNIRFIFELFFPIFILIFTGLLTLTIVQRLIFSFKSLSKIETHDKN
jgi:phosphatidylglycerophosphate synthase